MNIINHASESEKARRIEAAVQKALACGAKTPDLGGDCGTADVTRAVVENLKAL